MEINKEKEIELTEKVDSSASHEIELTLNSSSEDLPFPALGDRFEITEHLGTGAMGSVYRAIDKQTNNTVAIKVIKPELAKDSVSVKRFEQEVQATSKLDHESLASVFMTGQTSRGLPFIVMQYLEGKNLSQLLTDSGKLNESRAIKIFTQICEALTCAHENNILHRDLKPSNIIVNSNNIGTDSCWVVDFGISKIQEASAGSSNALTKTGDIIGSPYYMSPEQCQGESMDERSDIYSLGCLMAEVMLGEPLFDGAHSVQVILKHLNEPTSEIARKLTNNGVSKELTSIIVGCLAKQKETRYKSARDLKADLDAVASGSKPLYASKLNAPVKNKFFIAFLVLMAIFLIGMVAGFSSFWINTIGQTPSVQSNPSLKSMKSDLITDRDLKNASFNDKTSIVSLYLKDSRVTNDGLKYLSSFTRLKGLNLKGTGIGDAGLAQLSKIPDLDWLNLKDTKITDKGIEYLTPLKKMHWLYLSGTAIGDNSLKTIGKMQNLRMLCLTKTQITDKGIEYIKDTPLKTLHIVSTRLSDEGFKSISMIPTIETIQINKTAISDKGLGYLANLENLKSISANNTNISDSGIENLSKAQKLEILKLGSTKISNESLKNISKFKKLSRLTLSNTAISDDTIQYLSSLDKLSYLDLSNTDITDRALATISSLPNLRTLNVSTTRITDQGLMTLANSPKLKYLTVFGCKSVTPTGIKNLNSIKPMSIK